MNHIKSKKLTSFLFTILLSSVATASPRIETDSVSIAKRYKSGNSVQMSCVNLNYHACKIVISINKKTFKYNYDFADLKLRPLLGSIRLYANKEIEGAVIAVDVECGDEEQKLLPTDKEATNCVANLVVADNKLEAQEIQVQSYPKTYYREIN
jgi:hypothetical protein